VSAILHLGDCAQVLASFPDACIDLSVTSPPYDNLRTYKGYTFDFEAIARQLYRVTKPGGVVVWVVGDATINGSETGTSFRQALKFMEIGFNLHDTMIYNQLGGIPMNHNRYEKRFEYMFVLSCGNPKTFNPIMEKCIDAGKRNTSGAVNSASVNEKQANAGGWGYGKPTKEQKVKGNIWGYFQGNGHSTMDDYAFGHPAIFPEALARDHILSWSNPGDTVLDPMMGSGTTGKIAVKYQRNFVGIEIAEEYMSIARKRIEAAQAQPALFEVER
jgi:DNA modification methylase